MNPVPVEAGETVEVTVTHEIKIHGDKTWVGCRITGTVRTGETYDDAHARLDEQVQRSVLKSIDSTVIAVEEYTK